MMGTGNPLSLSVQFTYSLFVYFTSVVRGGREGGIGELGNGGFDQLHHLNVNKYLCVIVKHIVSG